jgi:hypothetical protein
MVVRNKLVLIVELYPDLKLDDFYIFFDEIQEIPEWEKYVRRLYDTVNRKILSL